MKTCEHKAIVNRNISATIQQLIPYRALCGAAAIDPKRDVMAPQSAAEEQLRDFHNSVNEHVATVAKLGRLRNTMTATHSIFGEFNAHKWN